MNKPLIRKIAPFCAANWLIYSLNALYYSFMPIYLKELGHSEADIGILLSIGPLISIFSPMIWGNFADRAKYKNNVLILILLASAASYFAVCINGSFAWIFVMFAVLMFFMAPFGGLIDTVTLEYASENNLQYGPMRLMGTFGFGLVSLGVDFIADYKLWGISSIFYIYIVSALLSALSVKLMAPVQGHKAAKSKKVSVKSLFKDKNLNVLLVLVAITQFAFGYYVNFYPVYLKQSIGVSDGIWGLNVLITVIGEIPFFIFFDRVFEKLGIKKLSVITLLLFVLRGLGLGLFTAVPGILLTSLITGYAATIITYCAAIYINSTVKPELRASGQTLIYALGWSVPRAIAGAAGGYMTDAFGVPASMLFCAVLTLLALLLVPLLKIPTEKRPQDTPAAALQD